MEITDIQEGNTNSFLLPAVGGLIAGGITTAFEPFVGVPLLVMSVALFFVHTGFDVETAKKQYRKYARYFGLKFGTWKPLPACTEIFLQLSVESKTVATLYGSGNFHNSSAGRTKMKSMTYDIVYIDQLGHRVVFHDFLRYKQARKMLELLAESLQIPFTDKVADKIAENRASRGR